MQAYHNVPEWLARVHDAISEGLPNNKAKEFPILFSKSVNIGSNLEKIKIPFLIFIVESVIDKFDHEKFPDVKIAIENVLNILKENTEDLAAVDAARAAVDAARAAARAAAWDAAWDAGAAGAAAGAAAWAAGAAWAAARAAGAAARAAAWAAAWAAARAAGAAAWAAGAAGAAARAAWAAARAAGAAARAAAYEKFADKLIDLIKDCKE